MGSDRLLTAQERREREIGLKQIQREERKRLEREEREKKTLDRINQMVIDFNKEVKGYIDKRAVKNTVNNSIGWVGGKWKIGKRLVQMMPEHECYYEVFFGGGSVFFRKLKSNINAINDINNNLTNMYQQIRDNRGAFLSSLVFFLYSRNIFDEAREKYGTEEWNSLSPKNKAVLFYYMIRTSFNNQMENFTKDQQFSPFEEYNKIIKISEKLQNVLIDNIDFRIFIEKRLEEKNNKKKLFYLDPPYVIAEGKGYYEFLFSDYEHSDLAHLCDKINKEGHYFMLSYENTQIIKDLYRNYEQYELEWAYSMQTGASKEGKRGSELIVTNFKAPHEQLTMEI